MCGIAGFWQLTHHDEAANRERLEEMNSTLTHRGPDEAGYFLQGPVGLANRRLSILDLEGGRQPVFNEDRSLVVVYNGEIYNYPELRRELEAKGHRFTTRTDTEILVHLYEEHGTEMVSRLRGMFAFALYDRHRGELFLARDPFGIKPLVYAELPSGFVFASELRALLTWPDFPRDIDLEAVHLYAAYNYIPAPYTIWKAARRLPPGHWMRVRAGRVLEIRPYFHIQGESRPDTAEEAVERLAQVLRDSVRAHLISDVPLGAFLSGGLDSSLVCALAQEALDQPLRTFTVTFPEWPVYDESRYARRVAQHLGTHHEEIPVTAREAQDALIDIVTHLDEPFADSSLVNVAIISKAARQHVKVVLSGDGGDEFFAGYNKYQGLRLAERLSRFPWKALVQAGSRLPWPERRGSRFGERVRQARKLARLFHSDAFERYYRATLAAEPELHARLLALDGASPDLPRRVLQEVWKAVHARGFREVNGWLWSDVAFVLPYDMLHKVDTASMRHSLEVRVPLVDVEVARTVAGLPGEWKLRGLERKWILKQVAARYFPKEILERPKGGFGLPIGEWMRGELRSLFEEHLFAEPVIWRSEIIRRLWMEHQERRRDRFWELWNIFVFEMWRRTWKPNL